MLPMPIEAGLYVILNAKQAVPLKGEVGYGPKFVLEFDKGKGLTILHSPPGTGMERSRILRMLATLGRHMDQSRHDSEASQASQEQVDSIPPDIIDLKIKSPGQNVHALGLHFLSVVPENGCLLADEVLSYLDSEHQEGLMQAMLDSRKQVIMTATDWEAERLNRLMGKKAARRSRIRLIDLSAVIQS